MGHRVQLIVGRESTVACFVAAWPEARVRPLTGEWRAVPLTQELFDALRAGRPDEPSDPAFDGAPPGLSDALSRAVAVGGALAYVETDYFGGTGTQSAGVWRPGAPAEPRRTRGPGAINDALGLLGVVAAPGKDAFETVGLDRRRETADYADEGAEGPPASPVPAAPAAEGLPLWVVLLLIAAAIGLGVGVAVGGG